MATITCFDGVKCIGGNKILIESGTGKLFFDFGKNFGREGELYDEFMKPKVVAGLYEYVQTGLLPPFRDLYREDLVPNKWDPWVGLETREVGDVGGVIVSHAHLDHLGAVGFLRPDIPVYTSLVTAAFAKAYQDCGRSDFTVECCYYNCREHNECGLKSPSTKIPSSGRPHRVVGEDIPQGFLDFWRTAAASRPLEAGDIAHASTCAGMKIKRFDVDHSVYGASAWAVETDAGWVVYTGDVRTHGGYGGLTYRFAEQAAELNPIALIIEGTRIKSDSTRTEDEVRAMSLEAVKKCSGLVVADFGPRNIERLLAFLKIARETDRFLAVLPKDAYMIESLHSAGGQQEVPPLDSPGLKIYWKESSSPDTWQKNLGQRYPQLMVGAEEVANSQDKFICCFSYYDINELAYIRPVQGSIYIFSSCEAFNEEMEMDAEKLKRWIQHFGLTVYGRISEKDEDQSSDPFHVSGHASRKDLMDLVRTIRPKILIPVHTEHPEIYLEDVGGICEVKLPEPAVPIEL